MPNPTMKAINVYWANMREQFIKTSIRTPRKKSNDSSFSSVYDFCEPHSYIGKIEKVGDQRSIIAYMKEKGIY